MSDIAKLQKMVAHFRDERDWKQFHNPKDVAISLVLEAAEFMEHFQWKSADEVEKHLKDRKHEVEEEVADVFYWLLLIANDLDIDLEQVMNRKMAKNAKKYPIEKAKGNHKKYTELS
jgi:dCTP diphosphatase